VQGRLLSLVSCKASMALGVAGDVALSPRPDCAMEKRRLRTAVSGPDFRKRDPLGAFLTLKIQSSPLATFHQLEILCLYRYPLLQQSLRSHDHTSLNDSFNSSYTSFTGYIYSACSNYYLPHISTRPSSPRPAFPGVSFSCPLDSSM
jgi:hypothetical protein